MKRRRKNGTKTYYIALNKANNSIHASITKVSIAEFLGINVITITRNMMNKVMFETDDYIIWRDITIAKVKRGFRAK